MFFIPGFLQLGKIHSIASNRVYLDGSLKDDNSNLKVPDHEITKYGLRYIAEKTSQDACAVLKAQIDNV